MKFISGRFAAAVFAAVVAVAGASNAATVTTLCPGTTATNDREFSLTTVAPGATCIAYGAGNISGNATGANADPLFSILGTGYQLIGKSDTTPSIVSVTGVNQLSGIWSLMLPAAPAGMVWTNLVLALKSGVAQLNPDWAAFGLAAGITNGTWSIASGNQSLSHMNLYGQLAPAPVPLPAAGILLLGGIGALAAVRRRRKA